MLTLRDYDVIEFVKEFKVASTEMIADVFYPSVKVCRRRMKEIYDSKKLDRIRDNINSCYIYFIKQPNQFKHCYLVSKFYSELYKLCPIKKFKIEADYGEFRADASFVYVDKGVQKIGLLEVEISNKGFDWNKYNRFMSNDNYKSYMNFKPTVFIVSDNVKDREINFDYRIIKTDFSNMRV